MQKWPAYVRAKAIDNNIVTIMNVYIPYIYVYMASVLLGQWQSANVYIQHTHTSHTRIRVCCTNKYGFHFIDTSLCTQFQSQCEQMCAFLSLSL